MAVGFAMDRERSVYEFGQFRLDPRRRTLTRIDGARIPLTAKAYDALVYLVEHSGELVTRSALAEFLWPSTVVEENNLSQAISVLRRTLGEDCIATVARRGYQFTADVRVLPSDPSAPAGGIEPRIESGARPHAASIPTRIVFFLAAATGLLALLGGVWLVRETDETATRDPLDGYAFTKLTEFEGAEEHAAISRDGRFVAFLRERDGEADAWVGQIGTGDFENLTNGTMAELRNASVRTLNFTPDGSRVTIWAKTPELSGGGLVDGGWAVPAIGGVPQPFRRGIAELDWSPDGRRIAYHTAAPGDPLFVADADAKEEGRRIYVAPSGVHNHFPTWSRDGNTIFFVQGFVPDEMDVWRIAAIGGAPERLTFHDSRVLFPMQLNDRTLLYLATAEDGSGPWIHALDLERRTARLVNTSGQEYTSIAASADGRRLVATAARSTASLWRVSVIEGRNKASDAVPVEVPTANGTSPRLGRGFVVYRAKKAGLEGIFKVENGDSTELWSGAEGRVVAGIAVAPDQRRLAFPVQRSGRTQLYVMNIDGSGTRKLAEQLDVRGAPAWSPDGNWIATAAMHGSAPRLVKVPVDGGPPVNLGDDYALDPVWSPNGAFIVYSGADVGTNFTVIAVRADGTSYELPKPLVLSRGSRRFDFLGDHGLVFLRGTLTYKEFWVVDLESGSERQLTALGRGPMIHDFDVADDGRDIVFDRMRDESDIVLIHLPDDAI